MVAASEASSVADLHPQAEQSAQSVPPAEQPLATLTKAELAEQWAEVQGSEVDAVAGQPMVWLDFKPPFAEPPPVLIPPKPDLGKATCNRQSTSRLLDTSGCPHTNVVHTCATKLLLLLSPLHIPIQTDFWCVSGVYR